jgi:hypothetical protein
MVRRTCGEEEYLDNCVQGVKAEFGIGRVKPFCYMYYQNAS